MAPAPFLTSRSTTVAPSVHRRKYRRGPRAADAERRVVGSDGGASDDRAMGATTKPGLLARPLVDRLVESVAATDQERNSSSGPDPAPLLMIGPGPGAAYASPRTHPTPVCTSPPYCTPRKPTHFSCAPVRKWRRPWNVRAPRCPEFFLHETCRFGFDRTLGLGSRT